MPTQAHPSTPADAPNALKSLGGNLPKEFKDLVEEHPEVINKSNNNQ